ncbi:Efflux pump FUS6, partial [Lachnellula arida]
MILETTQQVPITPTSAVDSTISCEDHKSGSNDTIKEFNPSFRLVLAFASLSVISLAAALDATSLSVALSVMAAELNGTTVEAFWSGTSFLVTSTVFQPFYVSLSDIFGRKQLILVALLHFTSGSLIAALAKNFSTILVGRSFQGVGAGGIISLTEVIITDMVPLRDCGKWFGYISGMWAIGSVSGPIVGGAFTQKASWRWIFWMNLPVIGVGYFMITLFLKLHPASSLPLMRKFRQVDWLGALLFSASLTSVLIPISWGGVMYPWSHALTLVPLILGLGGLIAFTVYELHVAREPMVRFSIFKNWTLRLVYLQTTIHGVILWSLLYYVPLYLEAVKNLSPIMTGVAMFPETFTVAPASILVGIMISRTGKYMWALWTGWIFTVLGMGLLHFQDLHTPTPGWVFLNLVPGIGTGVLFAGIDIAIPAAADTIDMGYAVAFLTFFRTFGQSIGVAVGGCIFQNALQKEMQAYPILAPFAAKFSQDAMGLVQMIKLMDGGLAKTQLIQAYADSIKTLWLP